MDVLCRICLVKIENDCGIDVFSESDAFENVSICDMIRSIASPVEIQENDEFTKTICQNCLDRLNNCYQFALLILQSDSTLRHGQLDEEGEQDSKQEDLSLIPKVELRESQNAVDIQNLNTGLVYATTGMPAGLLVFTNEMPRKPQPKVINGNRLKRILDKLSSEGSILKPASATSTESSTKTHTFPTKPNSNGSDNVAACSEVLNQPSKPTTKSSKRCLSANPRSKSNLVPSSNPSNATSSSNTTALGRFAIACHVCNVVLKNRYLLKKHMITHTGQLPHKCDICGKGFVMRFQLMTHRSVHSGEKPYKCAECGKAYGTKSSLISHRKGHTGVRPYQCEICAKSFVQKIGLTVHQRIHSGEKPYVCEVCSKQFTGSDSLSRHLKTHQTFPEEQCPICGKMYAGKFSLKLHLKVHQREKNEQCDICDKRFSTRAILNIHKRIHEGVKPFECDICAKRFTQANVLVRHMRIHSGETPYPCGYCEKRFSYSHHLLNHLKREHPDEEAVVKRIDDTSSASSST